VKTQSTVEAEYVALVAARKLCAACVGLINPARCANGAYDSDEIGPWTRWQGALDAQLMLVGQDWGDVAYFETHQGVDEARNPTNRSLRLLFGEAGFDIEDVGAVSGRGSIFLTNAVLCLKTGGLGAPVRSAWFNECGRRFLRPQVELVRPRALVALGERAYRSVCYAFGRRPGSFRTAVEAPDPTPLIPGVRLFPVYHCSPRVLAATRRLDQQKADWRRIGAALRQPPPRTLPSRPLT
jgi:DNA polymerase